MITKIVVPLFCLAISACAPIYVQPPAAGNATVRYTTLGSVELTSIQFWLNGRDCTERLRTTPEEGKAFAAGAPIVLPAGKEFAATLQATRKVEMNLGTISREVCDTGASFTPQPDTKYRIVFTATPSQCHVRVLRENSPSPTGIITESPDPTFRVRKVSQHNCAAD